MCEQFLTTVILWHIHIHFVTVTGGLKDEGCCYCRALDKREYWMIIRDNFLLFLHRNIFCDPSSELSR